MVLEQYHFTLKHIKTTTSPSPNLLPHRKNKTAPPIIFSNGKDEGSSAPAELFPASADDLDLISFKQTLSSSLGNSYTSLKDILPSSSPTSTLSLNTPSSTVSGLSNSSYGSGYEISIRNRLVKQAAWAYLQPTTVLTSSSSQGVNLCGEYVRSRMNELLRVASETMSRVYDWLVEALWIILCR